MRFRRSIVSAALAASLAGCAASTLPVGPPPQEVAYTLASGDQIRVTTFGSENISGEFTVGADGSVAMPLIGSIQAKGVTPSELKNRITQALRTDNILREPHVTVEVTKYRPFYILGEVSKPGEYPFTNGLTVLKAVATAQGFTYRANEKTVLITRDGTNHEMAIPVTPSTPVRPGDTVRVVERRL